MTNPEKTSKILRLLADGLSIETVALMAGVSERFVKHVQSNSNHMEKQNWTFQKGSDPDNQGLIYNIDTGDNIAITYSDEGGKNARLIAASPDLLDALIEALDQLESWNPDGEPSFTMRRVREAITKATQP